jgi:enoyl-CoA hydratase
MDLILTGRGVKGDEAFRMGLANRVVEPGTTLAAAKELATQLAAFPQGCLRSDRLSAYEAWTMPLDTALRNEFERGIATVQSGETRAGAARFATGEGRHGKFQAVSIGRAISDCLSRARRPATGADALANRRRSNQ